MDNTETLTSANRFKLVLSGAAKVARDRNQIDDFLEVIPEIITHIMWNYQMSIFTKEETEEIINHITSLQKELLL